MFKNMQWLLLPSRSSLPSCSFEDLQNLAPFLLHTPALQVTLLLDRTTSFLHRAILISAPLPTLACLHSPITPFPTPCLSLQGQVKPRSLGSSLLVTLAEREESFCLRQTVQTRIYLIVLCLLGFPWKHILDLFLYSLYN